MTEVRIDDIDESRIEIIADQIDGIWDEALTHCLS